MITLDTQRKRNYLTIGNERIQSDKDGNFIVRYDMLLNEDLSSVPAGTIIELNYQDNQRPEDLIVSNKIEVLATGRVRMTAEHYRCPCCWEHAMSYNKYCEAVISIFDIHNGLPEFFFDPYPEGDIRGELQIFSLEVDNGLFKDIEQRVKETVMEMLKPLLDIRDSFDAQILQKFGV